MSNNFDVIFKTPGLPGTLPELEKANQLILKSEPDLEIRKNQLLSAWDTNNNLPVNLSAGLTKYL